MSGTPEQSSSDPSTSEDAPKDLGHELRVEKIDTGPQKHLRVPQYSACAKFLIPLEAVHTQIVNDLLA